MHDATGLYYIALLHDIGKIGISENILCKNSPLTPEEQEIFDSHAEIGSQLLKDFTLIKNLSEGVRYHHTRYDSDGDISGIKIPMEARIIAIADYIDIARTPRDIRPAFTDEELIEKLMNERGARFDPVLVDAAIDMINSGYVASKVNDEEDNDMDVVDFSNAILERVLNEYIEDIKNKAQKDALTGLWNRRFMAQSVNSYLNVSGSRGALLMIDLDNFKSINDTFGHISGDDSLLSLSETLKECVRKDDILCRLGGDEFIAFIVSAGTKDEIETICKRICSTFTAKMSEIDPRIQASVSIGVSLSQTDGSNFETLYSKADKALYFVKQNKKGTYHFYTETGRYTGSESDNGSGFLNKVLNTNETLTPDSEAFPRIISFIDQYTMHSQQRVQAILFTLDPSGADFQAAFETLHSAVCGNLRRGDVFARYSDTQYIVILINIGADIAHKVAGRIEERYKNEIELNGTGKVPLRFEIFSINDDEQDV